MIKIMHMVSGNIIAAYQWRFVPDFDKYHPNLNALSPEAQTEAREKFNRTRVQPAVEQNLQIRRDINNTLGQCAGYMEIDTGENDIYCPPDVVAMEN